MNELHDKSVLVVDDDPGMLRAMTKVLASEGMQVTGVSDPVAVVKKLADSEKRFDVVISDLRMPMFSGRGGFGACRCPAGIAGYHHHGIWRA